MKKRVVMLFAAVLLSGCVSEKVEPKPEKCDAAAQMTDRGFLMLEAFRKKDYPLFARQFGGRVPDDFGEKEFESSVKQMVSTAGTMTDCRFLGTLTGPVFTTWLWAVGFEKKGRDGKAVSQEMLFKAVAGKLDGKMQIVSFGFLL